MGRLILAGLIVWIALFALVAVLSVTGLAEAQSGLGVALSAVLILLGLPIALTLLVNRKGRGLLGARSIEERAADLESAGLIKSQAYMARRAFVVEEFEDEGVSYYLELESGEVLFLSGQYLYEYEPTSDDEELRQERRFPCESFTVRRHLVDHYVVDVICSGGVFEPEVVAPPFTEADWKADRLPSDGDVLPSGSYEALKLERLRRAV